MYSTFLLFLLIIASSSITAKTNNITATVFTTIFQTGAFGGTESISGPGSSIEQTTYIRTAIPELLKKYGIKSMLDLPCGDFHWMQLVDLSMLDIYIGADIVDAIIATNKKLYQKGNIFFEKKDLIIDSLPLVDLLLCRDCFVHLPFELIHKALQNIKKSGIHYLLLTTFPNQKENNEISIGQWRALNFQKPPFNFPAPLELIEEKHCPSRKDKSLALWKIEDISSCIT